MQLKKIYGGQEAALDTSQAQREKREEIRQTKLEIQEIQGKVKVMLMKQKEREKKIKGKHERLIEISERMRNMQEVIRMKKIEEKKDIDR